jgi:hypothetical protein
VPSSDEEVCTSGDPAAMVTLSLSAPTSSLMSMRACWSTPRSMFDIVTVLKPEISAATLYSPVGSDGAVYSPLLSVVTTRVSLVPVLVKVTVTPGTTAPETSVIRPRMVPVTA